MESCLINPLAKFERIKQVEKVTADKIIFVFAIFKAVGKRFNPITITIGPTICGGKNFKIFPTPILLIINEMKTYIRPAQIMPPWAYSKPSVFPINWITGMKAKDEPKKTGTLFFVQKWKIRVPAPQQILQLKHQNR